MEIENSDFVVLGITVLYSVLFLIGRNPKMKDLNDGSFDASSNIRMFKLAIFGILLLIGYVVKTCS